MSILVHCPNPACAKVHKVKNRYAGKRCHCPDCNVVMTVPKHVAAKASSRSTAVPATRSANPYTASFELGPSTQAEMHPPTEPEPIDINAFPQLDETPHDSVPPAEDDPTLFVADLAEAPDEGATLHDTGLGPSGNREVCLPTEAEVTLVTDMDDPYQAAGAKVAKEAPGRFRKKRSVPDDSWEPGEEVAEVEEVEAMEDEDVEEADEESAPAAGSRWLTFGLGLVGLALCGAALASFLYLKPVTTHQTGKFTGDLPVVIRPDFDLELFLAAVMIAPFLLSVALFFHGLWGSRVMSIVFSYVNLAVTSFLFVYIFSLFLYVFLAHQRAAAETVRIKDLVAQRGIESPGEKSIDVGGGLWLSFGCATLAMALFGAIFYRLHLRKLFTLIPAAVFLVILVWGLVDRAPSKEANRPVANMKAIQ